MAVCRRAASAARAGKSRTCGTLSPYDTLLERLAQGLEDMALELGQPIQEQDAMMRQRDLPRHGQLAAADQAHIGDGVAGSAERAGGDDSGAPDGTAGDALDAQGIEGFGRGHRRQDGGEATRQH